MNNTGIITNALNALVKALLENQRFVAEYSDQLALSLAILRWLWYVGKVGVREEAPWGFALELCVVAGLGAFIEHFADIAKSFRNLLTFYGQRGLGSSDMSVITDPSKIIDIGFKVTDSLTKNAVHGWFDVPGLFWVLFCWTVVLLGFGWLTCRAFYVTTRWYVEMIVATAMLPFVLLPPTRFLALDGIKGVTSSSVEMMVMCILMFVAKPSIELAKQLPVGNLQGMAIVAVLTGALCWVVVGIPASMGKRVSGSIGEGLIGGLLARAVK